MKIIDAFCFFNELDMLELRLSILAPYVDHFIVVEADHTFSGKPKESCFAANQARFKPFADKISHHVARIDTSQLDFSKRPDRFDKSTDFWKVEFIQRNAISDALQIQGFDATDLAIASDVDEIPAPAAIERIRHSAWLRWWISSVPHIFHQEEFYYNASNLRDEACLGSVITSCSGFARYTPQKIRDKRKRLPKIRNGGYHFSYFMTPEMIANKISSFSHQEFNTDTYKSASRINDCINEGKDLFNRPIASRQVGLDHFPPEVSRHLLSYPSFCGPLADTPGA
jgi:beta-1,4-mannosyl-glycoprotein beta-1,4-N-acetylglucosaminyltransferase